MGGNGHSVPSAWQVSAIMQPVSVIPPGHHHISWSTHSWANYWAFNAIGVHWSCAGHAHIWHWATLRVHTAWTQHFFSTTHHWANHVTITIHHGHAHIWQWATLSVHTTWAHHFIGSTFHGSHFWAS